MTQSGGTGGRLRSALREHKAVLQAKPRDPGAVLDLSDRPSGVPDFEECLWVAIRHVSARDIRHALVVRVPGNKRPLSDHAEP